MTFELKNYTREDKTRSYIISTEQSRAVCNDPNVAGVTYSNFLVEATRQIFVEGRSRGLLDLHEEETTVFNVLRGGLNFGLRESLAQAYGWNNHSSAFVSAQRARREPNSAEWIITESSYKKIYLKPKASIVLGDVVATGTSLRFALERMVSSAEEMGSEIRHIVFFTIGGPNSFKIVNEIAKRCTKIFPSFEGAIVFYLEGEFAVATNESPLSIKIDGTDLLRRDCVMADAFVESQYKKATYPLERCTIYDAGSRSFDVSEYWHDVRNYWSEVLMLAKKGMDFASFVQERMPLIDATRYGNVDLRGLCEKHIADFPQQLLSRGHVAE